MCIACILILSYLRKVPPKFEKSRILIAGAILASGSFVSRINSQLLFLTLKQKNIYDPKLFLRALSNFFLVEDMSMIQKLSFKTEITNIFIGIICICAGAFVLMKVFNINHIIPMILIQATGFLPKTALTETFKILLKLFINYDVPKDISQNDNFLIEELKTAKEYDTNIVFTGAFPNEGIKRKDISSIFMNLIENAIEACKNVEKKREILINSTIIDNRVFVTISNPYEHSVKKIYEQFITTKSNKAFHGFGISNVQDVVEKKEYDGSFSTKQENNIFTAFLI